ncbi:MAG: cell division protein FtsL [Neisseria sp.]|nr:cell division protein FtsL [Neisseria sp.]
MNKWNALLLLAALASGLMLITVRNQTRDHFAQLNTAQQEMVNLQEEYEVLRIRQAELTNAIRIRALAQKQGLHPPTLANSRLIREHGNADTQ